MDFEFRYINEDKLGQCIDILHSFFGYNYYGADKKYLTWQYRNSVFKATMVRKNEYSILAVVKDGRILAFDAFLPWKSIIDGQEVTTIWDIEWINAAKVKGLGRGLVKELRSRCEIYCGYGLNSLSKAAYGKLGYSTTDQIERKVAILNKKICIELFATDGNKDRIEFISENVVGRSNASYCLIDEVLSISDKYWTSQLERFECISYKGVDYLKWRFVDHPYLKYHIISLDKKAEGGLAVVRLEKIKHHPNVVLRILDLLPISGLEHDLVNAVLQFGLDKGAILADFFCVSHRYAEIVCPSPFIPLAGHVRHDIPMLFQPIEIRKRKSINMVMNCDEKYTNITFDNFYATKADGDQDVYINEDYKTVLI